MRGEMVSIIMPSFNTAAYIGDSIRSVLKQTYSNWELLVVDDCSTDDSVSIIKSFNDKRIILLENDRNSGAAISRNYGLREAKGKYIAFLDSDDIWASNKLERQLEFIQKNHYAFIYCDYRISLNGEWENVIRTAPNKMTKRRIYDYCYFSTITVMYDKEKVGLIQIADLKKNNDYAMWIQALSKVDGYRQAECLAYYVKHENSISSGRKTKLIQHHYILWRRGIGKNAFVAFCLTINNLFWGVLKKLFYKRKIRNENTAS